MKKIVLCASLALVSSLSFAATALTAGGKTTLKTAQCTMIADSTPPGNGQVANIQLSADVTGSYSCTATNAGIGTAHPKGKGKSYQASSNGGKIVEAGSAEFGAVSDAQAAADAAADAGRDAS